MSTDSLRHIWRTLVLGTAVLAGCQCGPPSTSSSMPAGPGAPPPTGGAATSRSFQPAARPRASSSPVRTNRKPPKPRNDAQSSAAPGAAVWPYQEAAFRSGRLPPGDQAAPELVKFLKPSNHRDWSPDQAVLPWADINGHEVTIHNIRNAQYRTVDDYDVRHYDKTYDLDQLTSVDFIVVPFADTPSIAHVMLSFGFDDRDFLVLSVEIRKEKGEKYSAVGGFFRQYELMYVLADERDVVWKNAVGWLCDVYLYRARATPEQVRALLLDVLQRVNKLRDEPEFYHSLTNNCTTNIRNHINRLVPDRVPYDYRVLLPGYSDHLAYDLGLLQTDTSFEETRLRSRINYLAYLYLDDPDFSRKIRQ